jgi:hypothetical protein
MQSAIYYSFNRGRDGEIHALQCLSPFARSRTAAVVDLPTVKLSPKETLESHISGFVQKLASAWGTAPLYLDMTRYGPENQDQRGRSMVVHLFNCARQCHLQAIPVSGPLLERGPGTSYLKAVTRIAAQDGRGSALRLRHADFSTEGALVRELNAGLASLSLPARSVDLFLDAEGLDRLPPRDASEPALVQVLVHALEVLKGYRFRNVIFAGSSVPDPLPKHPEDEPLRIERRELRVWKQLTYRKDLPLALFGDTGVWSPHQPDIGGGGGGPPPARIRLPLGDEQLFFKSRGSDYRSLAKQVLAKQRVEALPRCWGLDSMKRAAAGAGGVETASGWVARDSNVHIEATALAVRDHLVKTGRFAEVPATVERRYPWQQESILQ